MVCNLYEGKKHVKNFMVQTYLQVHGYYKGYLVDGVYGPYTKKEVSRFQKDRKLTVDGCVGCETWNVLVYPPCPFSSTVDSTVPKPKPSACPDNNLKRGCKGDNVVALQQWLKNKGFYSRSVDGEFGPYTEAAVKNFQVLSHIVVDGVVGSQTRSAMTYWTVPQKPASESDAWVVQSIESRFGVINSPEQLVEVAKAHLNYYMYWDQQQKTSYTVTNMRGNCADITNDITMPFCRVKGWNAVVKHVLVTCSNGKQYGHYAVWLIDRECWLDLSAAAAHNYGLGKLICVNGVEILHSEGQYVP